VECIEQDYYMSDEFKGVMVVIALLVSIPIAMFWWAFL
jgi:hypothetical protein